MSEFMFQVMFAAVLSVCACRHKEPNASGDEISPTVLSGHGGSVLDGNFVSSRKSVVTVHADGTVRHWDMKSGEQIGQPIKVASHAEHAEVSQRGGVVLINGHHGSAYLLSPVPTQQVKELTQDAASAAFSADTTQVLTGHHDGKVRVWSADYGELVVELAGHVGEVWTLCGIGQDRQIVAAGGKSPVGSVWLPTGSRIELQGHTKWITHVSLSFDASMTLTVSWDQTAKVWETQTGRLMSTLAEHSKPLWVGDFSPDGSKIVTAGDGEVRVWNSTDGDLLWTTAGHDGVIGSIDFSPNGQILVTGGWDGAARVWETQTGYLIRTLSAHTDRVDGVEVDDGGQFVMTMSCDHTAAIWRL